MTHITRTARRRLFCSLLKDRLHQTAALLPDSGDQHTGYLFVYLGYDDASNNWVFFDDFKVTHTPTNVIQSNEYYLFGLQTANSWTREGSSNSFLYNAGSELNEVTKFYDTPFRGYDATLGRFMQVDPLAPLAHFESPYGYASSNPVLFNDPTGLLTVNGFWNIVEDLWVNTDETDGVGTWSGGGGYHYYAGDGQGNYTERGGPGPGNPVSGNFWGSGNYTSSTTCYSYSGQTYSLKQLVPNNYASSCEKSNVTAFDPETQKCVQCGIGSYVHVKWFSK